MTNGDFLNSFLEVTFFLLEIYFLLSDLHKMEVVVGVEWGKSKARAKSLQ